jgi:hypothetical protein
MSGPICIALALAILISVTALSDERQGEDSLLIDVVIFIVCLGGILYRHHKRREDEE